jgi:hypothetical protein
LLHSRCEKLTRENTGGQLKGNKTGKGKNRASSFKTTALVIMDGVANNQTVIITRTLATRSTMIGDSKASLPEGRGKSTTPTVFVTQFMADIARDILKNGHIPKSAVLESIGKDESLRLIGGRIHKGSFVYY